MKWVAIFFAGGISFFAASAQKGRGDLEAGFLTPPLQARPKALWPWVNGNVSLPQITRELQEACEKGMGGFDIWDVGTSMNPNHIVPDGPAFLSEPSLQAIAFTVKEAERLGLEIGLISSSSWNAGGNWIKPDQGAMGIFRKDTLINGPANFKAKIPFPIIPSHYGDRREMLLFKNPATGLPVFFREVAILAHPINADSLIREPAQIQNLEKFFDTTTFELNWQVPGGRWRISRYVCAPTGQPLMVPSPNSNGLMLDHFSAPAQEFNMNFIFEKLKSVLGHLHHRSLKYLYEDSYEVNSAVWTTLLPEAFEKRNGYSLIPYLPILDGFRVGNTDITRRFRFDFAKTLSDLIIENHYRIGTALAAREGLGFYAEAGGPGAPIHNVPFEDLKALGALTVPRGEFWNRHPQLEKLQIIKGISSAAHLYNQRFAEAESFTSVWLWQEGPGELKPLADRAMCEGLNRFVYHTFPHTTPESGTPGWVYNFGTLINTTNGWWPLSKGFHEYLGRCSFLLQQGNFVGDVAFYYGDMAPNFVPPKNIPPALGEGYDYDVVNTDAILHLMTVRDGRIYLPHGQYYEILVLPQESAMNPEVLKKITEMVSQGAVVAGPKPHRAYSLTRYKEMDREVKSLANKLWGRCDSAHVKENRFGKGKIIWGKTVRQALKEKGILPDFEWMGKESDSIDFIHRTTEEAEIYFLRNKRKAFASGLARFRVNNGIPEWWEPESGSILPLPVSRVEGETIEVPLGMSPEGSGFAVFRKDKSKRPAISENIPDTNRAWILTERGPVLPDQEEISFKGDWEIRFAFKTGTPVIEKQTALQSWHLSTNDAIRYYSGEATYFNQFEIPAGGLKGKEIFLDLGKVREIARVYLNGDLLGYYWHPSHRFVITKKVRPGANYLVVEVANTINNWLIGDAKKPQEYRQARSNISKLPNAWSKPFIEAPLIEAGLLGPVKIYTGSPVQGMFTKIRDW